LCEAAESHPEALNRDTLRWAKKVLAAPQPQVDSRPAAKETAPPIPPPEMYVAVKVLAAMGPDAKEATGVLIKLLENRDDPLRISAVKALGRIGATSPDVVPALVPVMSLSLAVVASPFWLTRWRNRAARPPT
jgi:HEAT repeat protein